MLQRKKYLAPQIQQIWVVSHAAIELWVLNSHQHQSPSGPRAAHSSSGFHWWQRNHFPETLQVEHLSPSMSCHHQLALRLCPSHRVSQWIFLLQPPLFPYTEVTSKDAQGRSLNMLRAGDLCSGWWCQQEFLGLLTLYSLFLKITAWNLLQTLPTKVWFKFT